MSRPEEVFVEGRRIKIKWDVTAKALGKMTEGYPYGGDWKPGTIRMGEGVRRSVEPELLLHELMHELWHVSKLSKEYKKADEENIITVMAGRITELLRDNPALVEFLTEGGDV